MSCYKCKINLCDLVVDCDNTAKLTLPFKADAIGEYKLILVFMKKRITFVKNFNVGDDLEFDLTNINENYCYTIFVELENNRVEFGEYNYFQICTTQEYKVV